MYKKKSDHAVLKFKCNSSGKKQKSLTVFLHTQIRANYPGSKALYTEQPHPWCICSLQAVLPSTLCVPLQSDFLSRLFDMNSFLSRGSRRNANERAKMHTETQAERRRVREGEGLGGCVAVKQRLPEDKMKT